ncbi:MAG: hypothetical protein JWR72_398 [Flavisolibacter sp.]|jgi:cell division protein FtsL|nr:hypothetical protein [Flavisolibacter sp.]
MKKLLLIVAIACLASCNETARVETELDTLGKKIDTLTKKIEDSKVADSIKSKGTRLMDSTKSKGGRLLNSLDDKLKSIKIKRDTTK